MKPNWRNLRFALAAALLLGLACRYPAFVFRYLIEPVARILWLFYRTLLSVDQEIYWVLLILGTMILLLRIIPDRRADALRPAYHPSTQTDDRVAHWQALLKAAEERQTDRLALQEELEKLHQSIGTPPEEITIHLPPARAGFAQRSGAGRMPHFLSLLTAQRGIPEATELEKDIDALLASMENQLEIHHD